MVALILKQIRKFRHKQHLKSVFKYIEMGASVLKDGFNVCLVNPVQNKCYMQIGDNSFLACKVVFESEQGVIIIGNNSFIGNSSLICRTKINIGNNVFIAWNSYIYDHNSHSIDYRDRENDILQQLKDYRAGNNFILNKDWMCVDSAPIKICDNVWIGMNCIILKGVTVGEGAIVGAGSVVTKDVPPWTIVAGNPAKVVKEIPLESRKNKGEGIE